MNKMGHAPADYTIEGGFRVEVNRGRKVVVRLGDRTLINVNPSIARQLAYALSNAAADAATPQEPEEKP